MESKYSIPLSSLMKEFQLSEIYLPEPSENIMITSIGNIIELSENKMAITETVPAGRILVDGLGVGDVGNIVLRDRKHLA